MGIEDEDDLIVDGADYMLDARNPKFQQDVREFLASVPVVADQDYVCFLKKLGEFCDRLRDEEAEKDKEKEEEAANEKEEVEPWYNLWLDGVTGYKRAYVFEGIDGEGRNVLVVYEYWEEEKEEKEKECSGRKRKRVRDDSANGGDGNENLNLEKGRVGKRDEDDYHGEISAGCSKEPPQADTLSKPPQADISKPSDERVEKDDLGQDDLEDAHLPFRERVLNLLRKPYDQEEHTRLMELAQLQKPIVYYRELRANDVKPYTVPGHMGKSYLDHHPDLQKLLRKVDSNNGKVLKVLRGFFFWLKHLTNDGAFRPWKDEACRALMLAS